jgi:hypothetical protein
MSDQDDDDQASPDMQIDKEKEELDDDNSGDDDVVAIPLDWIVEPLAGVAKNPLPKVAGKKDARQRRWPKNILPGRFHKSILPIAQLVDPDHYKDAVSDETRVALSRCLDVLADNLAAACASYAKPVPYGGEEPEAQTLTAVLAFNAIFSRIPVAHHDECGAYVQKILDSYCGVDSTQ